MRRAALIALAAGALLAACGNGSGSQAKSSPVATDESPTVSASRGVRLKSVGHFDQPVYVTSPPGDAKHLYVVEQAGRIRVLSGGKQSTFLDIRSQVTSGSEQGLLSIVFAPDYARSGLFYVYFTDKSQD